MLLTAYESERMYSPGVDPQTATLVITPRVLFNGMTPEEKAECVRIAQMRNKVRTLLPRNPLIIHARNPLTTHARSLARTGTHSNSRTNTHITHNHQTEQPPTSNQPQLF